QSQPPFTNGLYFTKMLEAAQLSRDDFLDLLGEPIASISRRVTAQPQWLTEVAAAFVKHSGMEATPVSDPATSPTQPKGFGIAAVPLIERGRERLRAGIEALRCEYPELPFDPDTVEELLLLNLPAQLLGMYGRTV